MNRGDIWFVNLDPRSGREQKGTRPVVIVSPTAFNKITKLPICCPITNGGNFARINGFAVALSGAGLKTTGIVRCDQPVIVDLATRGGNFVETMPPPLLNAVLRRLRPLFAE